MTWPLAKRSLSFWLKTGGVGRLSLVQKEVVEKSYEGRLILYGLCRIFRLLCCRVMGLVPMWWLRG